MFNSNFDQIKLLILIFYSLTNFLIIFINILNPSSPPPIIGPIFRNLAAADLLTTIEEDCNPSTQSLTVGWRSSG